MHIRNKLIIILIIFSFIPFLSLGLIEINKDRKILEEQIGNNSLELSRLLMRHIDEYLYSKYINVQGWTKNKCLNGITSGDEYGNISLFLVGLSNIHNEYYYINCLNTNGQVVASNNIDLKGRDMSTDAGFKEALNGNRTMQDVTFSEVAGGYMVTMSVPVMDIPKQSEIIGVLTVALKWDKVHEMITSIRVGGKEQTEANHIMLLNKDGMAISCFDKKEMFTDNLIEAGMKSAKYAQEHKEGYLTETSEHGLSSFATYTYSREYKDLPHLGWNLILEQDPKIAFAVAGLSKKTLIITLLGTSVLLIIISVIFANRISKPILTIVSATRAIGKGDLNTKVPVKSNDEISLLSTSFNEMVKVLRESQRMLSLVMDNIPQSIFWKDRKSVYLGCNKNFAEDAGVESPENIVEKTDYDLAWKKEEADFFRTCDERVMSSGKAEYHIIEPQLQADGKEAWLDTNKVPLCDSEGNVIGILGTYEDITERKEAEVQNRTVLRTALDGFWVVDIQGRILEVNDAYCNLTGYGREELLKMSIPDVEVLERHEDTEKHIQQIIKTGGDRFESKHRCKDGRIVDIDVSVNYLKTKGGRLFVFIRDITERKKAEELRNLHTNMLELNAEIGTASTRKNTMRLMLQEFTETLVKRLDVAFARIWTLNKQEKVLELQASAGIYTHIDGGHSRVPVGSFKVGLIAQECKPHMTNDIINDKRISNPEWAKREGMVAFAGHPLIVEGHVVGVMAMFAHKPLNSVVINSLAMVTDRIATAIVRKQSEEQTKASLREKEILLGEVYHRTKNNMNVICVLLRMQSEGIKDGKILTIFKDIDSKIKSMSLVHSKLYQAKDLSSINLKDYIADLVSNLFRTYLLTPDKISLKFIADDVPLSIDYAIPCGLAINEIITNSLKYAFPDNREGEIKINLCSTDKGEFELKIADNGIGMPEGFDIKNTDTLGSKLVFGLIEKQLGGKIELNCENGVEFLIKFKTGSYTKRV